MRKKRKSKPDKGRSDLGELYADLRDEAKARRTERRSLESELILLLEGKGYEVAELTEFQFRVNKVIDLYPTNKKFHDLRDNSRGRYGDALTFIEKRLSE